MAFDLVETRFSAGDGALYATPNEEEELADAILQLIDDPDQRSRMGEYNRNRFIELMAWEFSKVELVRAYDRLMNVSRQGEIPS